jgi:hypothetical protein
MAAAAGLVKVTRPSLSMPTMPSFTDSRIRRLRSSISVRSRRLLQRGPLAHQQLQAERDHRNRIGENLVLILRLAQKGELDDCDHAVAAADRHHDEGLRSGGNQPGLDPQGTLRQIAAHHHSAACARLANQALAGLEHPAAGRIDAVAGKAAELVARRIPDEERAQVGTHPGTQIPEQLLPELHIVVGFLQALRQLARLRLAAKERSAAASPPRGSCAARG